MTEEKKQKQGAGKNEPLILCLDKAPRPSISYLDLVIWYYLAAQPIIFKERGRNAVLLCNLHKFLFSHNVTWYPQEHFDKEQSILFASFCLTSIWQQRDIKTYYFW